MHIVRRRRVVCALDKVTRAMRFLAVLSFVPTAVLGLRLPWTVLQDLTQPWRLMKFDDTKVPVQLGVMSRCPDALLCESTFNEVIRKVADKIDLSLVYVAKLDPSRADFGVKCMHGVEECAGNVQQLCVAKYEPTPVWWEFVQCQNYQGRDKIGDADIALKCASAAGFEWKTSEAGRCAGVDGSGRGVEGVGLLKESVALGLRLGIEKSCTVLINGRKVCVHDETWKECENGHTVRDFVRQINEEYDRLNESR
ncbi:hypothetical protein Hypma_010208 [Hypsizygus marmoreus]|uniref:Uncharacterized protein n=1 Tax=Hypsizygus marmoreus TaxID=39966 RepID=A0A369JN34_HYPMA|nr:hypothetical protein Hypma_010208 [Hypsizygus marmoreus]